MTTPERNGTTPTGSLHSTHPEYLDDDGMEDVQLVRHDLARNDVEVIEWLKGQKLHYDHGDDGRVEIDVVWMRPRPETDAFADTWYDIVPEAEAVVRYWRLKP